MTPGEPQRGQGATQLRHPHLQCVVRIGRQVLAPQGVDQGGTRHHATRGQRQQGQQFPFAGTGHGAGGPVDEDLDQAQDADLHASPLRQIGRARAGLWSVGWTETTSSSPTALRQRLDSGNDDRAPRSKQRRHLVISFHVPAMSSRHSVRAISARVCDVVGVRTVEVTLVSRTVQITDRRTPPTCWPPSLPPATPSTRASSPAAHRRTPTQRAVTWEQ